jgi:hypothetical protein
MRAKSDAKEAPQPPPLDLRAHHLLCAHGLRGLGYSDEFVAHMRQVKDGSTQDSIAVRVHVGPDVICRACPHLATRSECTQAGGTERDRAAMAALGVEPGAVDAPTAVGAPTAVSAPTAVRPWRWWVARIAQRITPARLAEICEGCSWFPSGYCLAGIARLRQTPEGG